MENSKLQNNFFALLKDQSIKKISLTKDLTSDVREIFLKAALQFKDEDTEEIKFDGNYNIEEGEILYVPFSLPEHILSGFNNPISLEVLDLKRDDVKAIYWVEKIKDDHVFYFQSFDNRKLLINRNILFYSNQTYDRLNSDAFIIDNNLTGIVSSGKYFFKSYFNANRIFSLTAFYQEATNLDIEEFSKDEKVSMDLDWSLENLNTPIRKQITLIKKSGVLKNANLDLIKSKANLFDLNIDLEDGKIKFPKEKKEFKRILSYLNEQYFEGLISGNRFQTNSKRPV